MLRFREASRFHARLDGAVEIDEHHHPELRRETGEGDEAHRRGDGDGVVEEIDEPYAADERERQRQQADQRLSLPATDETQEPDDDADQRRTHTTPRTSGRWPIFALAGPARQ